VTAVFSGPNASYRAFAIPIALLCLLADAIQHPDARLQIGRRNVVQKFVSKFESGGTDLFNDPAGAWLQVNGFATAIVFRVSSAHPPFALQSVQQGNQSRLFDPEERRDFSLGQRIAGTGQVHQGAPLCLAQTHWFQAFVEFQTPGPGGSVEERTKNIGIIRFHGSEIVSLLTNSKSLAVSMPPRLLDLQK